MPEPLSLSYEVTLEDARAFQRWYLTHSPGLRQFFRVGLPIIALFAIVPTLLDPKLSGNDRLIALVISVAIPAVVLGLCRSPLIRAYAYLLGSLHRKTPGLLGRHEVALDAEGFRHRSATGETLHAWSSLQALRQTGELVIFDLGAERLLLIPRRVFPTETAAAAFVEQAHQLWQAGRNQPLPAANLPDVPPGSRVLHYALTASDVRTHYNTLYRSPKWGMLLLETAAVGYLGWTGLGQGAWGAGGAVLLWIVARLWIFPLLAVKQAEKTPGLLGAHFLALSPEGITASTPGQDHGIIPWSALHRLDQNAAQFLFWLDAHRAIIVPRRAFASPQEADEFLAAARSFMGK